LRAQEADSDQLLVAGRMKTDERIAAYQRRAVTKPGELHDQNLLAGAYIQKVREATVNLASFTRCRFETRTEGPAKSAVHLISPEL
jgi:hypothetical protein